MPVYDAESMSITARRVDRLAEDFRAAGQRLTRPGGASPFGDVEDEDKTDRAADTLGAFTDGMRAEFDTAVRRVSEASTALRAAVGAMTEADAVAADNLTLRERS